MAQTGMLPGTYPARTVGLVAVDGRTYPLKSAHINARAEGGVAATTFTQTYENPYQEPLEVFYTLPLPASGAVIGYTIHLGKKIIRGEVRRRAEAQEEYRNALLEGRTASLLEQERADTFTQKLGSLPPGETAGVEIEVLQPLAFLPADGKEAARWEYRFPTVAGVRYEGAEGRVPDADKLDTDRAADEGTPARLDASLFVADGPAGAIHPHSSGLEIALEDISDGVSVSLRQPMKLDRDLVIRWLAARQEVKVRPVEGRGLPCDNGRYVLITLTPPAAVQKGVPRDLTILIDASGSMSGKPLSRAKIVVEELLRSLDAGDRFEIMAFADRVELLTNRPREASDKNVQIALTALRKLEAGGATEMTRAMVEALHPLRQGSQRQVVLLTDGYIGFEGEVIGEVLRRLAPGARLHTVGIGAAPNRTLTRGAARAGRGVEILVGDDDDAQAASRRLLQATVRPVLTDIEVRGTALVAPAPRRPQDVLQGQPLVFLAEVTSSGGELQIRANQAGAHEAWVHTIQVPAKIETTGTTASPCGTLLPASPLPLGALFGREAIEDLEMQLAATGRGPEAGALETQIENLGLRHGIVSRKTSLIAISEDPTVDPKDPRRRQRLAVEIPADVSAEGTGLISSFRMPAMGSLPLMSSSRARQFAPRTDMSYEFAERAEVPGDYESASFEEHLQAPIVYPEAPFEETGLQISGARVLRLDGSIIIFEFEVPATGFMLPNDGAVVSVGFDDGITAAAQVLGKESSTRGPHQLGLTVRLALKLEAQHTWRHREAWLTWCNPDTADVSLHITLESV